MSPYTPTEGFTEKELSAAIWWQEKKPFVKKIFTIALLLFNIYSIGYSFWGWGSYLFRGVRDDAELMRGLVVQNPDLPRLKAAFAPKNFEVIGTTTFAAGHDHFDAITRIRNPNSAWTVTFEYAYVLPTGNRTDPRTAFFLPHEEKIIGAFGQKGSIGGTAQLDITEVRWQRVSRKEVADPAQFFSQRLAFEVGEVTYVPAASTLPADQLMLTVTNNSAFSYWSVRVFALLYAGDEPFGVEQATLDEFRSGQSRRVDVRTAPRGQVPSRVETFVEVNVLDEAVYMR